ncbi:MAG: hypothetical protein JNJ80_12140 [Gemmatimonadetes bacterium]|nr:hypothetical protein [Gemmatimonadota bacterium]
MDSLVEAVVVMGQPVRWVFLLGLAAGCAFAPEGAIPIEPPPRYRDWWAATEVCSGRRGDFARIEWAIVPGRGFACPTGTCVGRWEGDRIYLAEAFRDHELVVRHEILHALLDRPGHPDPPFGRGCPLTWSTWRAAGPSLEVPLID